MSLESWKARFYPTPAEDAAADELVAAKHSLRKWVGLRRRWLACHQIMHPLNTHRLESERSVFAIASSTCALCAHNAAKISPSMPGHKCRTCILAAEHGAPCDEPREYSREQAFPYEPEECSEESPWHRWALQGDPEEIISLLKHCITKLLKRRSPWKPPYSA